MKGFIVRVDYEQIPALHRRVSELVDFRPSTRLQRGLMVDVRVIETGEIWCRLWASRCMPLTKQARELLEAHETRRKR